MKHKLREYLSNRDVTNLEIFVEDSNKEDCIV
jgi:hypothetical protein